MRYFEITFRKGRYTIILCFMVVFLAQFFSRFSYGQDEAKIMNPHDFKNKEYCAKCHTADIPKLNHDPVTTCTKCHMGNIANHPVYRHPINVQPSRKVLIPPGFPLTVNDSMVCYTCHDYHNTTGMNRMLWIHKRNICVACHVH